MSKGPSFESCAYLGDATLPPLMRALASDDLLASDSVQTPVDAGTQVPYLPRSPQISRPRWREADLCLPSSAREYGTGGAREAHVVRRTALRVHTGHSFMNRTIKRRDQQA